MSTARHISIAAALVLLASCAVACGSDTDAKTTKSPQPVPSATEAALRGYFSPVGFWNQNFAAATSAECAAAGANSLNSTHAWRLPGGELGCSWGPLYNDPWGGRIEGVELYFDPRVDAQAALAAVTRILPADSQQLSSIAGVNSDDSKYPDGSCQELIYTSGTLAAAVGQTNPDWTGARNKVSVVLYSGNATGSDGSDVPFQPGSVHLAALMLGDNPPGGC